jgi:tetratricopeptide (TPR) repeat protein
MNKIERWNMEKHIITNLRKITALISKKTREKLHMTIVDGEVTREVYYRDLYRLSIYLITDKIDTLKDDIEENDRIAWLTYLRGMVCLEHGMPAGAYKDFLYVMNSDHSDAEARSEARFLAGLAAIQLGKADEAINHLNEFRPHNKASVDVVYWLGIAYFRSGNLNTAKEHFDAAILFDPSFEDAYLARGKVHISSGNLELALNDFYKIIELNPKNAEAQDFIRMVEAILKI